MKIIIKLGLFGMGLLLALVCLHGCFTAPISPPLTVSASPDRGHPPFDVTIVAACPEESGMYTLIVNDEVLAESDKGTFVTRVLNWPWRAVITWSNESGGFSEAPVIVLLENETAIPHGLWTEPNTYPDQGLVLIDLRHLEHGCINGMPVSHTGFEDPDGDTLMYRVLVEDMQTGEWESVFYGPDRTLMGDECVSGPIFYWFVNYAGEIPIYQYAVWSPQGCVPTPSPSPGGSATREKRVHVYILEVECDVVTHWAYDIVTAQPGCSP